MRFCDFRRDERVNGRRRGIVVFTALVICVMTTVGVFDQCVAQNGLAARMDTILKRELPDDCEISFQLCDLTSGKSLLEKNPDLPLVPASTLKVVTSAAALYTLHPDFRFLTEVWVDGVKDASVQTLYLKGTGDPHLVNEELFKLTRELKDKGLAAVRGAIVVDDSYFVPGKPLDESEKLGHRAYHAPYGALSLNFNSIRLTITPAARVGQDADISVDPESEYLQMVGKVATVKGSKQAQFDITKGEERAGGETAKIEGTIGVQAPAKSRYVNVAMPAIYTGVVCKEFLLREGIKVAGKVVHGKVPPNAGLFLEFPSLPLGVIVYWLNKHSNNFMAEQVSLAMGAHVLGVPGTREKGLTVIRRYLQTIGVQENLYALSEASGLSRNNKLSASALVRTLQHAAADFTYGPEFMSSLGVSGVDGTLKEKFTDSAAKRRLRAKTGTLRGVNSLAGYGTSTDGRRFVFAMIVNSNRNGVGLIDYGDRIMRAVMDLPMRESGK